MKKAFWLSLHQKYLDQNLDSIYVIDYEPRKPNSDYFHGRIWLNTSKNYIQKITLNANGTQILPFKPIRPSDKIEKINYQITKTFLNAGDQVQLNHIDFTYEIQYFSDFYFKTRFDDVDSTKIRTESVIFLYDYSNTFLLPLTSIDFEHMEDYRRIGALPYIPFFWDFHTEYTMQDKHNANDVFFKDTNSINNVEWLTSTYHIDTVKFEKGLWEHPFIQWSANNRFIFKQSEEKSKPYNQQSITADKYHFEINLFLDINKYADSVHFTTATILDPFKTKYHLPVDTNTLCFANILFDLAEIERINLHQALEETCITKDSWFSIYEKSVTELKRKINLYQSDVKRGTNLKALTSYNQIVYDQLGIDNMKFFGLKK